MGASGLEGGLSFNEYYDMLEMARDLAIDQAREAADKKKFRKRQTLERTFTRRLSDYLEILGIDFEGAYKPDGYFDFKTDVDFSPYKDNNGASTQ
jgi:hypothetical protein